jgi:hypothetical protein
LISGSFGYKDEKTAKRIINMLDGTYRPKEQKSEVDRQGLDVIFKNFFNQT